ncbi:MAG: phosphonate ABC transporter substrate-binding protein, partial [Paracoccaceae bacterium]|nr:phosphonate ABC transporter substrate-binding protein [Paracoccaceae bacterium]
FTALSTLPDEMIDDVTAAVESFPSVDPEGFAQYTSFDPADENPQTGYMRVDHDRYQWIVDMRAWLAQQRRG